MSQKIKVNNIHNGNPGLSGWYAILPKPEPPQVLTEDINAEWIVIGGGFAGLSAARRLLQLQSTKLWCRFPLNLLVHYSDNPHKLIKIYKIHIFIN